MRELDELLLAYLEEKYDAADDAEKAAFRSLLELPDPQLMAYLLQNEEPGASVKIVVDAILQRSAG